MFRTCHEEKAVLGSIISLYLVMNSNRARTWTSGGRSQVGDKLVCQGQQGASLVCMTTMIMPSKVVPRLTKVYWKMHSGEFVQSCLLWIMWCQLQRWQKEPCIYSLFVWTALGFLMIRTSCWMTETSSKGEQGRMNTRADTLYWLYIHWKLILLALWETGCKNIYTIKGTVQGCVNSPPVRGVRSL